MPGAASSPGLLTVGRDSALTFSAESEPPFCSWRGVPHRVRELPRYRLCPFRLDCAGAV